MTYYELDSTAEPTITGSYPQLKLVDHSNMNRMFDIDWKTFITSNEELADLKFTKGVIKTDVLTCRAIKTRGLVVSEKFKDLIEKLVQEGIKTTPFQFIPLNIKNSVAPFYLFQLIPDTSIINYKGTVFEDLSNNDAELKINNHEAFRPFFSLEKLALKNNYDLFMIPYGFSKILISEKVKNTIEQHGITGIKEIQKMRDYEIL